MLRFRVFIAMSVLFAASIVKAGGIPVFDASNFANLIKTIGLSEQQIGQLTTMIKTADDTLAQAVWIHDAVTGKWDPKDFFRQYFERQFNGWLSDNVPAEYRQLVSAAMTGRMADQLRSRYSDFSQLSSKQIDPWNPGSMRARHVQESQRVYDQSRAAAEVAYDEASKTMETLTKLQGQIGTQSNMGASIQLGNQIALAQAILEQANVRVRALDQIRAAQQASGEIEGQRRWQEFVGKPRK